MNFKKNRKFFSKKINICLTTLGILMLFVSSIALLSSVDRQDNFNSTTSQITSNNLLSKSVDGQPTQIPTTYILSGADDFFNQNNTSVQNGNFNFNQIYPSQHFGDAWLGIDQSSDSYQYSLTNNNDDSKIHKGIKQLVLSAIRNLPNDNGDNNTINYLDDDKYLKVNHFYIDNYSGQIVANITLNIYNNASGLLVDCVKNVNNLPLTQNITFSGFKKASATIISNSVNITQINGTEITSSNISDFAKDENFNFLKQEYINNGIGNAIKVDDAFGNTQKVFSTNVYDPANINDKKVVAFPGIKQLRTTIGVTNFFKDSYVDPQTFKIYDSPSPSEYRIKIGSFIFGQNQNLLQEKSFVANYEIPSNEQTTFVIEGSFDAPPSLRNKTASSITNLEEIKNNMFLGNDITKLISNPFYEVIDGIRKITTDWEIITTPEDIKNKKLANDITGELTLQIRLVGNYYYLGNKVSISTPPIDEDKNKDGFNRIYTIVIKNFQQRQATSIVPQINILDIDEQTISNQKASEFTSGGNLKSVLIHFLRQATEKGNGFTSIPYVNDNINDGSDYDSFFNENSLLFENYRRIQDDIDYFGIPNDKDGTLRLTIKIKKYYSPFNGYLVDANNENDYLILTTKLVGFTKVNLDDYAYLVNNPSGFLIPSEYSKYIAKDAIGSSSDFDNHTYSGKITIPQWKQIIQDLVIVGNKNAFDNVNDINISLLNSATSKEEALKTDQSLSLNDSLSSNILGQLNLHFGIKNILDNNDGIKITKLFSVNALFKNFNKVKATKLVDNLTLNFVNSSNIPFASDVIEQYTNGQINVEKQKEELKRILLQRDGSRQTINIKFLFNDQKGIPQKINDDLIENSISTDEELSDLFDKYFEIDSFDTNNNDKYYQNGEFDVILGLKLYYNENGDLIDATDPNLNNNPINYTKIKISGFKKSNVTSNVPQVQLVNVANKFASDYINPADLTDLILKQMLSDFNNQLPNRFFTNLPNNFFNSIVTSNDGKLSSSLVNFTNITINNVNGNLSATMNLSGSYFDENNTYITNNKNEPFLFTFTGFNNANPTFINRIIKIGDLINPIDESKNVSNQLNDWSKKVDGVNPTNELDLEFLKKVIKRNMLFFIENPYRDDLFNDDNYFQITSPTLDYEAGEISFNITLNYFYNNVDAFPISPDIQYNGPNPSNNNTAKVTLVGFEKKGETSVSNEQIDINNFDPNLANFSSHSMTNQKDALKQSIINNASFLNSIFYNLPSTYNLNLSNNPDETKEYINDNLTITRIEERPEPKGSIDVYLGLKNIFIRDKGTNKISIGDITEFPNPITIKGFKESSKTSFTDSIWDLDPTIVSNNKIAYWNIKPLSEQKTLLEEILNQKEIITKFTNNLVYDQDGTIKSKIYIVDNSEIDIVAKDGIINCSIYLSPYYNDDGIEMNDQSTKLSNLKLRNFPQQNITQQNNAVIYTSELETNKVSSNEDPIFGKMCNSIFLTTKNIGGGLNNLLKDQLLLTGGDALISKMLFNVTADDISIPTNKSSTTLEDIKLISSNDFNGSLNFKIKIKNYFDKDGNWTNKTSDWLDEIFSIYQLNKVQKTNLTKVEASVTDISLVYKNDFNGSIISFNPSLEPSEFLDEIFNSNIISEFQQFIQSESIINKGLFGINAIFGLDTTYSPSNFQKLSLIIGDRVNNPPFGNEIKNFITANDSDGTISIKVTYQNVYQKEKEENLLDLATNNNIKLISLDNTPENKTMVIKISGFKKNNQTKNLIISISIIIGSVGFILLLSILIFFIIKKARSL